MGARRAFTVVVLCVAAVGLTSACAATNPQQTVLKYNPVDGETVSLGSVQVDNLLVVSKAGTEGPGNLVARLTNSSSKVATVSFAGSGSADLDATFTVPSNSAVSVGPDQDASYTLTTVGAQPGGLVDVTVSDGSGGEKKVQVPVLSGVQPYYATLVPTPTPTPTFTPPPPSPTPSGGRSPRPGSMTPAPSMTSAPSMTHSSMTPSYSPRTTLTPSSSPVT